MISLVIDNTLNKLRLIGWDILDYNSFGIIAKQDKGDKTLFIRCNNNKIKIIRSGIEEYRLNSHFIITGANKFKVINGIYTKGNRSNFITKGNFTNVITSETIRTEKQSDFRKHNREVLMLYGQGESVYLLNSKGKLVFIGNYNICNDLYRITYIKDENGRYWIRYIGLYGNIGTAVRFTPDLSYIERKYKERPWNDPNKYRNINSLDIFGYPKEFGFKWKGKPE